jgi:hypothetical protein
MGHEVQCIVSLRIRDVGICAVSDEELNDVNVSITSGPLHWSSDEVTTERINFCALFEEVAACRQLRIDCGPVEGSNILGISVRC